MANLKQMKRIAELERQMDELWFQIRMLKRMPPVVINVDKEGKAHVAHDMIENAHLRRLAPPKKGMSKPRGRPRKVSA